MTFVDDYRQNFDAADFCETVKAGVGEGRITSSIALHDGASVAAAVRYLQDFSKLALSPLGPDVVAAYVVYSPGAPEIFTALRAISVNTELVSAALECLNCIVKYSLDGSKPQQPLEHARSVVKEIVKSRAVLIYDILAKDGKSCAKKALNLLRLVAVCHAMLAKELVNRFDLSAKSMAPSLCNVTNNHCRVPFLDLMFAILACGENDVLHYLAGKGREVIVTCLRTIQERTSLEADGGVGSSTKSILWKQGKSRGKKAPKVLPSHVQKRELIAAINFLLAVEKHLLVGLVKSRRGLMAHPLPTMLATIAATEIPPLDIAPREVRQEHETLRSTATRMFISICKDPHISNLTDIIKPLNSPSFNFGAETVVKFVTKVIQAKPQLATHLLESGRILSAQPALTLRWFGYYSVVASSILRLQSPTTIFKEKHFFEKCLSHADPLIRHLGAVLAMSFCKVIEKDAITKKRAEEYLPSIDVIHKMVKPGANEDKFVHRLVTAYQSLLQSHVVRTDVKLMIVSVDAAGDDVMVVAGAIERALRSAPYSAVRKIVHKGYLSKLIMSASQRSRLREAQKLWCVCKTALLCTDLFPAGTDAEIDVYLSVLSSLGKDAEEPAKAFEAMIAQALEMPYGLYDRLHSDDWSEESVTSRTSHLSVAAVIKLQKLEQKRRSTGLRENDDTYGDVLKRMLLSIVASSSILHGELISASYLSMVLPSIMDSSDIWWKTGRIEQEKIEETRQVARRLLHFRGSYPKTKFLKLIEALVIFDEGIDKNRRDLITPKANAELGLAWDSWCSYWHSCGGSLSTMSYSRIVRPEALSRGEHDSKDFIFCGVLRLLLHRGPTNDLHILKKVLPTGDYRFATAMMLRTAEIPAVRHKLIEETVIQLPDLLTNETWHAKECEFLYMSVLHTLSQKYKWSIKHIDKILLFCHSMISKWDSLSEWRMHVPYSIAVLKTLLLHGSHGVAVRSRSFLSRFMVDSLPNLVKLTPETIINLLMVCEYSPCLRQLAIAQVYNWSEKDHRSCSGVLLRLLDAALSTTDENRKNRECELSVLDNFSKASLKSRTMWTLKTSSEDDTGSVEALESIARKIAQARKPCELFLQRFSRSNSDVSKNSWVLLAAVLNTSKDMAIELEVTSPELERLLRFIIDYIRSFGRGENGYPELICLQVLERVTRHLRLRKFSLHRTSSSMEKDIADLCKALTICVKSQFNPWFSEFEPLKEKYDSVKMIDFNYTTSLFACLTEILKLDLSLEKTAARTLADLLDEEGRILCLCLQNQGFPKGKRDGNSLRDPAIQFLSLIQAALPWLSHAKLDDDVARSVLYMHMFMSSQLSVIASGRSERHSSARKCFNKLSDFIKANDLKTKLPSIHVRAAPIGVTAVDALNGFPKPLLEEASDYVLQSSYQAKDAVLVSSTTNKKYLDPFFVLTTFLQGSRQALQEPQVPVLDLHRIARDGILALALTGIASTSDELRALSYACLQAFAAVVGPVAGVSLGSASGLYKDRRQLAFMLELLRNSISEPMTRVLPLFAVWFRTATRVSLNSGHLANKLVTTFLLRAPCMDVSDCFGLSHFLNCEAGGSELQAIRLLAFEILQKGVHSQRDISLVRKRRVFDKIYMFAASAMGFHSSIRLGALKTLEAILHHDENFDITDELVGAHGIILWLANDARHLGETLEELITKLKIMQGAAEGFTRRRSHGYASVLADALALFTRSRLKFTTTAASEQEIAARIAECGASISKIAPKQRYLFRIDFSDLWIKYMSKEAVSYTARQNLVRCICRQRDTVMRSDILEMLLEHAVQEVDSKKQATSGPGLWGDDLSMIHAFVAECLLALKYEVKKEKVITAKLCFLLAKVIHKRCTIWLVLAAITTLDLFSHLSDKMMTYTDKIPAFLPQEVNPHFEQQFSSMVQEMSLALVDELVALGDKMCQPPVPVISVNKPPKDYHATNGIQ